MHNVAADPFRLVSGKAIGDIGAVLEDWQGELVAHQGDGVRCDDFVLRTCQRGGQRLVQVAYNDVPGIFIASLAGKYRGEEKQDYDDAMYSTITVPVSKVMPDGDEASVANIPEIQAQLELINTILH